VGVHCQEINRVLGDSGRLPDGRRGLAGAGHAQKKVRRDGSVALDLQSCTPGTYSWSQVGGGEASGSGGALWWLLSPQARTCSLERPALDLGVPHLVCRRLSRSLADVSRRV
jgi:hypothetical protein